MAKPTNSAILQSDVEEYLRTQDDFALELFVNNEALKAEFDVSHGGTYEDSSTKKHRQYDLRASKVNENRRVDLAIECKALRSSFPLLVSCVPRSDEESEHAYIDSYRPSGFAPGLTTGEWAPARTETIRPSSQLYPVNAPVGKAITQIGRTRNGELTASDAETYDKWSQALASATDLIRAGWLNFELSTKRRFATAVVPILVVSDSTLWVATYKTSGELVGQPQQKDTVHLFVGREYPGPASLRYHVSHLHILTKAAVKPFFIQFASGSPFWEVVFPSERFPNSGA